MVRDTIASTSAKLQSNVVKALTGYYRLKDFIHAIRACKTLAEERSLVARESAAIRTSFKEDISPEQRHHAVAKLLVIYMMSYPAHFGQMESLKMVALPKVTDKRLGYLGSTQLLDDEQATLTLITNSIKSDLNSPNQTIVALALSNLSSAASSDIARDLMDEIARLINSSSPYIKKKAAFCAARLICKVPELAEDFEDKVQNLLSDRNHSVVLGGITLAFQLCQVDSDFISKFRRQAIPVLIRHLQGILSTGFSAEYDVAGINDPFLQVRILKFIRLLGEGDRSTSDAVSDILTQIATSTDPSKNVGHAVLYETAVTIMNIESDSALRTMAINILGRLLSSNTSDNNLRYVALALLNKIIAGNEGYSAVQRHRATILECIHEGDFSIKKRAVDLAIALITKDTIKSIAAELLNVLKDTQESEENDFRQSLITRLAIASAHYAPNGKWYIDTMKTLFSFIGNEPQSSNIDEDSSSRKEEIVSTFLRIVNNTSELHRYATEEFYKAAVLLESDVLETGIEEESMEPKVKNPSEALIQATAWMMGEFADILISSRLASEDQLVLILSEWSLKKYSFSQAAISYFITALGKLSNRLSTTWIPLICDTLNRIASEYVNCHDLHYRALEMKAIAGNPTLRGVLLSRFPPDNSGDQLGRVASASTLSGGKGRSFINRNDTATASLVSSPTKSPRIKPLLDVFAELATMSLNDPVSPIPSDSMSTSNDISPAFKNENVKVYFRISELTFSETSIKAEIYTTGEFDMNDVLLQCAVPKSLKLRLDPANSTFCNPGVSITQNLYVYSLDDQGNRLGVPVERIKLRVKLSFREGSSDAIITHIFDHTMQS